MSIIYNELTAKFRKDSLNLIPTINSQSASKSVTYQFACVDTFTDRQTVKDNFVLTAIKVSTNIVGGGTFVTTAVYIDDGENIIFENLLSGTDSVNRDYVINIPNWLIRKGSIITVATLNGGGSQSTTFINFVGYLI